MKHLKTFFACLLMAVLSIGQMWADSYTIAFKSNSTSSDATSALTATTTSTYVDEGASYVSTVSPTGKVFLGASGCGLKFGNSSNGGSVTLNLASAIKPTSIVVSASQWSATEGTGVFQGTNYDLTGGGGKGQFKDYTIEYDGNTEVTTISVGLTKRGYVKSITVNYGGSTPTPSCTSEITITKADDPANGTFAIDNSGTVCIDEGNATVNVTATPNTGYHLATVTSTVGTVGDIDGNTCEITDINDNTTISVSFAENPKYKVSFNVGGSSASQADITEASAGAGITLPAGPTPTCSADGWTFAGWAAAAVASETTTAPTLLSGTYHPTANVTLYAVYKRSEGAVFDGTEGGDFYIYAEISGTKYYATAFAKKPASTTDVNSAVKYTFEKIVENEKTYFAIKSGNAYLSYGTSGTDFTFTGTDPYKWEPAAGTQGTWRMKATTGSNRSIVYRAGSTNAFAPYAYTNVNGTEYFDVEIGGGTTYYLSAPTCCTPHAITIASPIANGSVTADKASACEDATVTLTFTPAGGYHLDSWSVNSVAQDINTNTFTMPDEAVTVSATFEHDPCDNLGAPTLDGEIAKTYNSATIAWNEVADAEAYAVSVVKDGESEPVFSGNVNALSKALENLEPETQYNYTIMAVGDGTVKCADGNGLLEGNFTTEALPTAVLTLMENGNEVAGGSHAITVPFALPAEVSHTCTKVFVGWDADPDCATAPTYAKGANFTFANTTGVTLYAVYADAGNTTYTKTAFADLASGDEVVITGNNGDMYAMSNDNGASNAPTAVEIAEASENVLNVTGKTNIFWIITKDGANFSFTVKGGTDKLYCTGDNNGVRVGTGADNVFSMKDNYMYNNGRSAYVGIYSSQDWRRYTSINSNITGQTFAFYKAVVTYSNYATTCVEPLAVPTFNETAGTYNVAKSIVLSAAEGDVHYTVDGTDPDENSPVYSTAIVLDECGSTTIKAIAVDGARISEIAEATYVIKLPIDANTEEGAYTAAEAKAIIDEGCDLTSQQVYVKGTVQTPTYYSSSHTYTITLAGEEGFQLFKLYDLNGAEFTSDYIKAGDQIVAYGYLKKYNSTYELDQNCYLVSYEEYTEPKTDIDNTIDNPWTVAQADGFMDAPAQYDLEDVVFVKGVVTGFASNKVIIRDTENGTEYIELYKSTLADGISALIQGDLIIATGTLNKYNNSTYQMNAGCQVVWKKAKATIEIADINIEVGDELALSSIEATITPEAAQSATISYEVTAGTAVSISNDKIIAEAAGEATITASIATTEDYIGASKEITVTVTAPDTRKIATASAFTALSGDMSSTDISFAAYQGDATNAPVVRSGDNPVTIRMYKAASGKSTGGYLTLTAKVGCTIDQVKIEFSGNADAAYCKDAEALPTEKYITGQAELLTPTGLAAQSVSIVNLKNGSIDVAAITVWYNGAPMSVHHYVLGGTYPTEFEQYGTFSYEGLTVTAAYNEQETITEPISGFTVEADLMTAGNKKAEVYLDLVKIAEYNITVTESPKQNPALAYTPSEQTITLGDAWTAPTLDNPLNVEGISYTSSNTSVAKVTSAGVITLQGGCGEATITASFAETEAYVASSATYTITVNEPAEVLGGKWELVNEVLPGMRIIIANEASAGAIKTMGMQNSNNRAAVASSVDANGILTPAAGTKTFLVVATETEGQFALQARNGNYIYAASNSSNHLKEEASIDANGNANWTIEIDANGVATIKAQGSNSSNWIRYNTSGLFSCYGATNTQEDVYVYAWKPYTRNVSGNYGTICLPNGGVMEGASIFEIAYFDNVQRKIFFDEVVNGHMVAGRPYIFLPNEGVTELVVCYTDQANAPAANYKGLHGSYFKTSIAKSTDNFILYNNQYYFVNSDNVYVGENRAYLYLPEAGIEPVEPAPGRRRVSMSVQGKEVATDIFDVVAGDQPMKVIINNQLFIIRGGQMYDMTGNKVQ